jgi:uncharacterized repeat protein (TIGR03803 family)
MKYAALRIRCMMWLVLALPGLAATPAHPTEAVLHHFAAPPNGAQPYAGVIRDAAGNLYGTTTTGGAFNIGVIFMVDTSGQQTVLHNFENGEGNAWAAGLVLDAAGNLYGTTPTGGTWGAGTVYKLDSLGNFTTLYTFMGGVDGGQPYSGLVLDSAGNLYGTTTVGGVAGLGTVYMVDTSGNETVLHSFLGPPDGSSPYGAVTFDQAGNLYGTTYLGGASGDGIVYKLDTSGQETVLHTFDGGADGASPTYGVTLSPSGNLYGTTVLGGPYSGGTVFAIDPQGNETVLHSFSVNLLADGANPSSGVILDSAGNLYGTTSNGGSYFYGVVYKLDAAGQETVLCSLPGDNGGGFSNGGLVADAAGNLYGTTYLGGAAQIGLVFMLGASGQESVLYNFPGPADGSSPYAGVTLDSAGNLYGTTRFGGVFGSGTVWKVQASGKESVLHTFTGGADGGSPQAGVTLDTDGNLYGTTYSGGASGSGVVFKLDAAGNETVLHSFAGGADGGYPAAGVIRDSAGKLYGTTEDGGVNNWGVVYSLDSAGNETVLHTFTAGNDGAFPLAGVIRDSAGNLYGTAAVGGAFTYGVVFMLDPAGNETVLYSFTGGADGKYPYAGVIRDSGGNLYGTTNQGGPSGGGAVYELDSAGHLTVLHGFAGGELDGSQPAGGVVRDKAGNLYGTTFEGGLHGYGVVFKVDSGGNEKILHNFNGSFHGAIPEAGVILDMKGNLVGTTRAGGKQNAGIVFKIAP